jgi:hypothetical protein
MTGDALPLAARHLDPRIGEAFICVEMFRGCISVLGSEVSDGDGRVAKHRYRLDKQPK